MNFKLMLLLLILFQVPSKPKIKLPLKNGIIFKGAPTACEWYDHSVVTILAAADLSIRSCSKGTVLLVNIDSNKIVGSSIVIRSDSTSYFYTGIDTVLVKKNQVIEKGDLIGVIDEKNIYGKRINFFVRVNGKAIDAKKYLIYEK